MNLRKENPYIMYLRQTELNLRKEVSPKIWVLSCISHVTLLMKMILIKYSRYVTKSRAAGSGLFSTMVQLG